MIQKVKESLHEYFSAKTDGEIGDGDNLFSAGILDSMGVLELVYHLESNFGVEVDPDEISEANFKSLDAISAFMGPKLK